MGQLSALWFVSGLTCGALGMFVYLSGRRDRGPVQSIPRQVQETLERFEAHWDGRLTAEIQAQMQEWRSESGQWHGATYDAIAALSAQLTALTNQPNRAHQTAPLEAPVTESEPALEALPVDPLASDAGIDYRPLNEALGQRHWKTADEETRRCLVLAAGRGDRGWLSLEDWATIPATDLRTIDHLWRYWSGDRYGLWPQWHLWQTCGGDYGSFCDRNGWRQDGEAWLDYEDLWFSSDGAIGHLPTAVWHRRACYGIGADSAGRSLEALLYAYGAAIGAL
ncbi:MAG: hypothetical protein Fur0042_06070 [Cyanophyceae cyanobacterium]